MQKGEKYENPYLNEVIFRIDFSNISSLYGNKEASKDFHKKISKEFPNTIIKRNHELKQNYLAQFRATEETEKEMEEWYSHLIRMMKEEGIQEGGRVQINRNIILWLTDLHNQLLQSSKFPFYTAAYYKALPYIVELRNKGDKKDVSELENCFDALYGVMLLRLQHKPISDETAKAVADITKLLAMLSDYYKQDKAGELKFE